MHDPLFRLPAIGDVVGDYRILGVLGEGGHGHVYRAEAFGRSFALKFLDRGLERFGEREVQTLIQLKHPGVVRFLACGRWPDPERGLFYVVMELVEGLTLYDYVMLHNPSARKVGELVLSLGRTLLAVQEAGVLHRDVKRENIMVRLPGEQPVVLDFGLAALAGAPSSAESGPVTGTLEYLSPEAWEHARGEEDCYRPTPKDEQWALGVTFYWLLTDRLPFGLREDPLMTRRVLREQPKAPHVINPRVPPELGAVCLRLLEKNPEDRYADLKEMCGELRRALEDSVGEERWEALLGQPDAPECRTTDIDPAILARQGIELELLKIKPPRRGRVRKRPEFEAPAAPPPEPPPEADPVAEAVPGPIPGPIAMAAPLPEAAPLPPGPVGWRQRLLEAVVLSPMGVSPDWGIAWSAARRAAAWTWVLVLALAMGPTPAPVVRELLASTPVAPSAQAPLQPVGEVSPWAAWQVGGSGQKLAPVPYSPQSAPGAALTPASVAEPTLPQDEPDVKTPRSKSLGPVKKAAAAAAAAMALGCPTTHVRPIPEPMECPPGALENMEKLGIMGREARFRFVENEGSSALIKEGWTTLTAHQPWDTEPEIERLSGKIFFGERVYGRITQATLSDGSTLRVCMELFDQEGEMGGPVKRGAWCEPTRSPDTVRVRTVLWVKPVDHFE